MEKKIRSYKEIFGISKKELMKACAKHARYLVLAKLTDRSYLSEKKINVSKVKMEYYICTTGNLPKSMDEESRWLFILNWKREKYYLDEDCYKILEFADLSNDEVRNRARKIRVANREREDLPF